MVATRNDFPDSVFEYKAPTGNNNVVTPPTASHVLAFQTRVSEMLILWTLPPLSPLFLLLWQIVWFVMEKRQLFFLLCSAYFKKELDRFLYNLETILQNMYRCSYNFHIETYKLTPKL